MSALFYCIYYLKSFATQHELVLHEEKEQCTLKFSENYLQGNQNEQPSAELNQSSDNEVADPVAADNINSPMAIDMPMSGQAEEQPTNVNSGKLKNYHDKHCCLISTW